MIAECIICLPVFRLRVGKGGYGSTVGAGGRGRGRSSSLLPLAGQERAVASSSFRELYPCLLSINISKYIHIYTHTPLILKTSLCSAL